MAIRASWSCSPHISPLIYIGSVDILGAADEAEDIAVNEFKGRGNSTWGYPKKPYTIKFAQKESLLGMPKDKRWNLLANWMDVTGMRNEIALELARRSPGLDWTPRGKYVELVYNGKHNGNYYLCEHIKISKDRVNITAYDADAPAPANEIGYLLEFDVNYDEANKFRTTILDFPVNVKDPDAEGFDLSYISGWVNSLEAKLTSGNISTSDYRDSLDIDSFIDWFFVHELTGNWEPSHPKSSYMYKNGELAADHKIHAGPCWDFDYQTFVTGKNDKLAIATYPNVLWYKYLFMDRVFIDRMKEKWAAQMESYKDVASTHINQVAGQISSSVTVDKAMWPLTGSTVNGDESLGFYDAALRIQTNLLTKIANMDGWIKSL